MGQKYIASLKRHWLSISTSIIAFLFALTITYFLYQQKVSVDQLINRDIGRLVQVFEKINKDVGISGFEHPKNYIDFLNVISFVGSEIGPMNIKNPKGWQGPYLDDNPTMQEQYYLVVKHGQEYYITPGTDVKLSSGYRIGTQVDLDNTKDLHNLLSAGLAYKLSLN